MKSASSRDNTAAAQLRIVLKTRGVQLFVCRITHLSQPDSACRATLNFLDGEHATSSAHTSIKVVSFIRMSACPRCSDWYRCRLNQHNQPWVFSEQEDITLKLRRIVVEIPQDRRKQHAKRKTDIHLDIDLSREDSARVSCRWPSPSPPTVNQCPPASPPDCLGNEFIPLDGGHGNSIRRVLQDSLIKRIPRDEA